MNARELLDGALATVDGNQAELARRLGRSETTVSRWRNGKNGIDYESALRLARLTGLSLPHVLQACGLDPNLIPITRTPATSETPRLAAFLQAIEERWRALDEAGEDARLEAAEDGTLALFSVRATRVRGLERTRVISGRGGGRQKEAERAAAAEHGHEDGLTRCYRIPCEVLATITRLILPRRLVAAAA